jgi:hypothetical protein
MSISASDTDDRVCELCGRLNKAGSAFCADCGASLEAEADETATDTDNANSEQTVSFAPVRMTEPSSHNDSPWAPPDRTERVSRHDDEPWRDAEPPAPVPGLEQSSRSSSGYASSADTGGRGFFLGLLGVMIILVVLAVYVYSAWLNDATRSTLDGWVPW